MRCAVGSCRGHSGGSAVQCKGNFQVTKYGLIATPYCEEQQIAAVARSYGVRVTDEEMRRDPLNKVKLCYRFGGDVRDPVALTRQSNIARGQYGPSASTMASRPSVKAAGPGCRMSGDLIS